MPKSSRPSRKEARARREQKRNLEEAILESVIHGVSHDLIARHSRISISTVRRKIDSLLERQRFDGVETYVKLQQTRLNRAMMMVIGAIDNGDLRGVPALAVLFRECDRYQGVAGIIGASKLIDDAAASQDALALQNDAAKTLKTLTHDTKTHTLATPRVDTSDALASVQQRLAGPPPRRRRDAASPVD